MKGEGQFQRGDFSGQRGQFGGQRADGANDPDSGPGASGALGLTEK